MTVVMHGCSLCSRHHDKRHNSLTVIVVTVTVSDI
jgi:hypothetical protein